MVESNNMYIWDKVKKPPSSALKQIKGGRLTGMTDINPMWRYKALTTLFGPCGQGWKYDIKKLWTDEGSEGSKIAHAMVDFYYMQESGEWSSPIPGVGGSMLIKKETSSLFTSDEGYKMAVTDAISTAIKMIGVGADIYAGKWDGSKYKDEPKTQTKAPKQAPAATKDKDVAPAQVNSEKTEAEIEKALAVREMTEAKTKNPDLFDIVAENVGIKGIKAPKELSLDQCQNFLDKFIERSK